MRTWWRWAHTELIRSTSTSRAREFTRLHRCPLCRRSPIRSSIDGYTQPGSAANTQTVEDDAVLLIELNGANAGDANGLTITAGSSTIRGLVINRFIGASGSAGNAIALNGGSSNVIEGNFLGTDAAGTTAPG